eukprot:jgi/Mesen1/5416/ME000269S04554
MSIIDACYGSGSESESEKEEAPSGTGRVALVGAPGATPTPPPLPASQADSRSTAQTTAGLPPGNTRTPSGLPSGSTRTAIALPDAASLFGPPGSSGLPSASSIFAESSLPGVSTRVGAGGGSLPDGTGRKREGEALNGSGHVAPAGKSQRSNLPPHRRRPDTAQGALLPPQLRGRSNVATEDLDRLFVRKQRQ